MSGGFHKGTKMIFLKYVDGSDRLITSAEHI